MNGRSTLCATALGSVGRSLARRSLRRRGVCWPRLQLGSHVAQSLHVLLYLTQLPILLRGACKKIRGHRALVREAVVLSSHTLLLIINVCVKLRDNGAQL